MRFQCTKDNPWDKSKGDHVEHKDTIAVLRDDDYYDYYRCLNCGTVFSVEVPE